MKNKLAENMLRFGPKNLTESEVEKLRRLTEQSVGVKSADVSNISLNIADMLSGNDIAEIKGDSTIYTFPERGNEEPPAAGDVATYDQTSVLYHVGGNQYVVIGQLGKLTGDDASNWSISNPSPQVFTFLTTPYSRDDEGFGNNVRPYPYRKPFSASNPALVIANLAAKFKGRGGKIVKDFVNTNDGKEFINKMVKVFQVAGLAQDVTDMDKFYEQVAHYI